MNPDHSKLPRLPQSIGNDVVLRVETDLPKVLDQRSGFGDATDALAEDLLGHGCGNDHIHALRMEQVNPSNIRQKAAILQVDRRRKADLRTKILRSVGKIIQEGVRNRYCDRHPYLLFWSSTTARVRSTTS